MAYEPITSADRIHDHVNLNVNSYEMLSSSHKVSISAKESVGIYSRLGTTWKTYWQTQTIMLALFVIAWITAASHIVAFVLLDGKPAEGPHSLSQSYVAALSHFLGLAFRTALCGSLAVAFTQYLWRQLRKKAFTVSSIELLFKILTNPFLLTYPEVIITAPILFFLALFAWVVPIAIIFPPGALIVVPTPVLGSYTTDVQIYNGSSFGNNSQADVRSKSLAIRGLSGGVWQYLGAAPTVQRIGRLVLELDDIVTSPSPCGSDCTYNVQFEGPYLQCTSSIYSFTQDRMIQQYCELNAFTATSTKSSDRVADGSGYGIGEAFNMTAFRSQRIVPKPNTNRNTTLLQHDMLSCSPSRALYNVTVTYRDGLRTITRSERYLGSIREKIVPLEIYDPKVPACDQLEAACYNQSASKEARVQPCALYDTCYEQQPADWPQPLRDTFTAFNDFALIDALISPLSGNYTMFPSETFVTGGSSHFTCGPTNGSIVADTRLNIQRDNYTRSPTDGPEFVLSADILNDALFNVTMSTAFQLGFWSTPVPVQATRKEQQYSFAFLKTILIPYIVCLTISIPFLYLGIASLRYNGVSAIEGGFLQILMTTTGSKTLEKAAAGGCLGGDENVPEELKKMKIRFGELVGFESHKGTVKRAGFGTEDEVIALRRDIDYGVG